MPRAAGQCGKVFCNRGGRYVSLLLRAPATQRCSDYQAGARQEEMLSMELQWGYIFGFIDAAVFACTVHWLG
jgi:hypothetical protein